LDAALNPYRNRLPKLKSFLLIGILAFSCAACNAKNYSSSPVSSNTKSAQNDFLYNSPLKKLSATADFTPLLTNAERLEYCNPGLVSTNDKVISDNLFEMALKAPTAEIYDKILQAAFSQLGTDYRRGGTSPRQGFDCSGFTTWVFNRYGIDLPRSSRQQYQVGQKISKKQLRKGDLVFFKIRKSRISHVGIYLENGKFIHSARPGRDVEISSLNEAYWSKRYAGGRRVIR
jgi:cell wall-associated NlpC family hydrolase